MKLLPVVPLLLLAVSGISAETEIGFIEKFALAEDREATLQQLIPGKEDYYYFHALYYQLTGNAQRLGEILDTWSRRFPDSERRRVIENRSALLHYGKNPQATIAYLREKLGVSLNHEQVVRDRAPDLPNSLDQSRIAPGVFQALALEKDDLQAVSPAGIDTLVRARVDLRPAQLRSLLGHLSRPDVPGVVDLVERGFRLPQNRGFGEFPIHSLLLADQLDELAARNPALFDNPAFVFARLRKMLPSADTDLETNSEERQAWLDRSWTYVARLSAAFNSLRAQILFQRLEHDRSRGVYEKERFLDYLKLPRRAGYVNPAYSDRPDLARYVVDPNANYAVELPVLRPVGADDGLVREYLLNILRDEPSWEPWTAWLRDSYVKPIFAEAKITAGIGNPEEWASLLTPVQFQALKDRVDVDFAPSSSRHLAPDEAVSLDLFVKNVPKLIVKVYELNTLSFYLAQKRQLNTDLNLDGLIANDERTHDLGTDEAGRNPFRRVARKFSFPELTGRGAWIVEFIGGGKSSRALIRKGQWQLLQRIGPAGDMLTVLDEKAVPVRDAVAWVDGRRLAADPQTGLIVVPFSAQPGPRPIVLSDVTGSFATFTQFEHHSEQYRLDAQVHVEREQLLARRDATLAVRAALLVGDSQVPLSLLSDVRLVLATRTLDGVSTSREVSGVKLDSASVFTHTFPVPDRLASVEITLSAKVENLSAGGTKQDVSAKHLVALNGIDATPQISDIHLAKVGESFVLDVLGKSGEPLPAQPVRMEFKHRAFPDSVTAFLSTDAQGRVKLGALAGITKVSASHGDGAPREWPLADSWAERPESLHARIGEPIRLPWTGSPQLRPEAVTLLEARGGTFLRDRFDALSLADGFLVIQGLPPGDYSLFFREEARTTSIRVSDATAVQGWLVSPNRLLELRGTRPVHIASAQADVDSILIQLRNVNPLTRVHVSASRFLAPAQSLSELGNFQRFNPASSLPARRPNLFAAGRAIGDEYRYILERRYSKTYPGNQLPRPGLLLQPWEVRSTDLEAQTQATSEALMRRAGDRENRVAPAAPALPALGSPGAGGGAFSANLDFLANAAAALYNLRPDENGIVRISRKALGDRQFLEIYAEDAVSSSMRTLSLPEVPTRFADLRLSRGLDPAKPFTEKKDVTALATGQTLTLADILTSDLETYDSLAGAHALLATLSQNADLGKFSFILNWPQLDDTAKRANYSEFACHELNFFLSRKDPKFFAAVVQPYLRNKKERTFIDEFLIGADLRRYLDPWMHGRLNAIERCLLAQRIPGEGPATTRHLRELWELLPPATEESDLFFETALRGRMLDGTDADGDFRAERGKLEKQLEESTVASLAPIPATAAAPAAPAPMAAAKRLALSGAISAPGDRVEPVAKPRAESYFVGGKEFDVPTQALAEPEAVRLRQSVRQYFRELGPAKEWAENQYWHVPLAEQTADLVTVNAFWRDYAAWDGRSPFLSPHLPEASRSFTEMMFALAVLDLPFAAEKHSRKTDGGRYTLTAASPLLAFHKQIKPAGVAAPDAMGPGPELLVSENFFRVSERYRDDGNEKSDRYVTEEFLAGVLYGAKVVVTNPHSTPQKLVLLQQIPEGALPANGSKSTDSRSLRLEPFTTQTFEYFFYFPQTAERAFQHYPVHVSRNENAAGAALPLSFKVVKQLSSVDKESWDYVSQYGSEDEVFAYLEKHNVARLDLEKIAWRARQSAPFFRKISALIAKLHVWSEPIARYALLHNDPGVLREWLRHQDQFIAQCGPWLDSTVLRIDPVERHAYEHLEYSPLVNQRAHRLGGTDRIPNPVFRAHYQQLLDILAHKTALEPADEMSVVYFLFLQDRIEEALTRFQKIRAEALPSRLQHDYFRCYAALYEERIADARRIAGGYVAYPVDRWRKLFAEVIAQLDEVEGRKVERPNGDAADRETAQANLAATEPSFDFKIENRTIALTWKNLSEVTINYYLMDPEFLFSASPFVTQDSGRFAIIKPTLSVKHPLPANQAVQEIGLPAAFAKANVLVEVLGAGQRKAQPYHANSFKLTIAENYGRLDVRETPAEKPLSKAYVKVYARLRNGTVRFFKDGYTDLRGKFDYASLNSGTGAVPPPRPLPIERGGGAATLDYQMLTPAELNDVERLAILVMSDTQGAAVREVSPPSR